MRFGKSGKLHLEAWEFDVGKTALGGPFALAADMAEALAKRVEELYLHAEQQFVDDLGRRIHEDTIRRAELCLQGKGLRIDFALGTDTRDPKSESVFVGSASISMDELVDDAIKELGDEKECQLLAAISASLTAGANKIEKFLASRTERQGTE